MKRPRFKLRSLFILTLCAAVFLWWVNPSRIRTTSAGVWIYPRCGCWFFGYYRSPESGTYYVQWWPDGARLPFAAGKVGGRWRYQSVHWHIHPKVSGAGL